MGNIIVDFNLCEANIPATANPPCNINNAYAHMYKNGKCNSFK